MAYIGKSIESGTFSVLDTSGNTYNGSNTTFNLGTQVGSPAQLLVSHDGVIQKPGTDYSLASGGTQITFSTAPASGASIFIVEISGAVGGPLDSDLNGAELILDADADTSITADTDDQIDIKVANTDQISIKDGVIEPTTDNDVDIGASSKEFKDGYFDGTLHCDVLDLAGTEYTSIGQGKILQVVSTAASSRTTTTSSSEQTAATSSGITPSATSSKILVLAHGFVGNERNGDQLPTYTKIYRSVGGSLTSLSSSKTAYSDTENISTHFKYGGGTHPNQMLTNVAYTIVDSPSTTSEVTYLWKHKNAGGGTDIVGGVVFNLLEIGA